jgi:hypothetical protein
MNTKTMKQTGIRAWVALSFALVATGCGSKTHFFSTWGANDAQPVSVNGTEIAAVFFNTNESVRREGEDVMVNELARFGGIAFPSYKMISEDPSNRERAKVELEQRGIDAVISMRVIAAERVANYAADYWSTPYYGSLWGYWGQGWAAGYDPTSLVVRVETLLYSLKDDKLLWAGMSETIEPDDVESAVKSIARKAVKKMDEEGVLTKF